MLISGQVFSSFCGLPVLTVAGMKRGERQSTLITSIAASCLLMLSFSLLTARRYEAIDPGSEG